MKRIIACAVALLTLCSCAQIQSLLNPTKSSSGAKYDAATSLKPYVMANIKMIYVDPSKASVGSMAEKDMGNNMNMAVAIVGEQNGNKIVELTASYMKDYGSGKLAVVSMEVDNDGKVLKAWGGLVGTEGVELTIPEPIKIDASGKTADVKTEDIDSVTLSGISASGKKYTTSAGSSKVWTSKDFAFFGGVIKTEAGASVTKLSKFEKSGAKAQLKLK